MLEPALKNLDPYERLRDDNQTPPEDPTDPDPLWLVETLLDRKVAPRRGRGKGKEIRFLIKWKGWGHGYNE